MKEIFQNYTFETLRREYKPVRVGVTFTLANEGIDPDSTAFRRIRANFAKQLTKQKLEIREEKVTGLYNRHGFYKTMEARLSQARREGNNVTLLLLDTIGLKSINDTYGQDAGDELIQNTASIIKENTRSYDVAARWGGDEFMIALYGTSIEDANGRWYDELNEAFEADGVKIRAAAAEVDLYNPLEISIGEVGRRMIQAKRISSITNCNTFVGSNFTESHYQITLS